MCLSSCGVGPGSACWSFLGALFSADFTSFCLGLSPYGMPNIPYSNRTIDVLLPQLAFEGNPRATVKGIIDDFHGQLKDNFNTLLEAFVLLGPQRVRVTCKSPHALEEFRNLGLTFRGFPIDKFLPCSRFRWVNVTRLSYGISDDVVVKALLPYGKVSRVKMDSYKNVYVGTRNALMEVTTPIPSRILIAGHWCHIFYEGQLPTCFKCNKTGHTGKDCPPVQRPPMIPHNPPAPALGDPVPDAPVSNISGDHPPPQVTSQVDSILPQNVPPSDPVPATSPSPSDHPSEIIPFVASPCGIVRESTPVAIPTIETINPPPPCPSQDEIEDPPAPESTQPAGDSSDSDNSYFSSVSSDEHSFVPVGKRRRRRGGDSGPSSGKKGKANSADEKDLLTPNMFSSLEDELQSVDLQPANSSPSDSPIPPTNPSITHTPLTLPLPDDDMETDAPRTTTSSVCTASVESDLPPDTPLENTALEYEAGDEMDPPPKALPSPNGDESSGSPIPPNLPRKNPISQSSEEINPSNLQSVIRRRTKPQRPPSGKVKTTVSQKGDPLDAN